MTAIEQTHYGKIEVVDTEPDIVQIWNFQKHENNVVMIERENLPELIKQLQKLCS